MRTAIVAVVLALLVASSEARAQNCYGGAYGGTYGQPFYPPNVAGYGAGYYPGLQAMGQSPYESGYPVYQLRLPYGGRTFGGRYPFPGVQQAFGAGWSPYSQPAYGAPTVFEGPQYCDPRTICPECFRR